MEQELFDTLSELEMHHETERIQILDPDSARLLSMLAISKKAQHIVEIGSGVGYSTLWLAYAMSKVGGKLVTCEIDPARVAETQANLEKANLIDYVEILAGDARETLRNKEGTVDMLFIDAEPGLYETFFDVVYKRMEVGGMIVADDVIELESELSDYVSYMQNHSHLESTTVPLGNGLEITVKVMA
jgi:predicted O-methyltransferase YrrM